MPNKLAHDASGELHPSAINTGRMNNRLRIMIIGQIILVTDAEFDNNTVHAQAVRQFLRP